MRASLFATWRVATASVIAALLAWSLNAPTQASLPEREIFEPHWSRGTASPGWTIFGNARIPQTFVRRVTAEHRAAVARIVAEEARSAGLDPVVLVAMATQESGLRPANAVTGPQTGRIGGFQRAVGTLQILPATARRHGCGNIRDTRENARCAARIMRHNLRVFGGDQRLAIRAYHGGENRRYWGRNNANYDRMVALHMNRLRGGRTFFASSHSGIVASADGAHADERYPHTWGRR